MSSPKLATYRSNMLLVFFSLFALISSAWCEITDINFPQFSANDTSMQAYGDAQFNAEKGSWIMNAKSVATSNGTCALLMYYGKTNMRIQDSGAGTIAAFSTSFTFKFTTPPQQRVWDNFNATKIGSSLMLVLTKSIDKEPQVTTTSKQLEAYTSQPGACTYYSSNAYSVISIRTVYNIKTNDPSNNFIGIIDGLNATGFKPGSTYNLCGNQTHCSYLSTGESFTAWIDFTPQRTLQVRLMNGSHPHNQKPVSPLFEYPNFQLPTAEGDYLFFTFTGSSIEHHIESHELSSWSFYSSGIPETISSPKKKWVAPVFGAIGALALLLVVGFLSLWFTKNRRSVPFSYSSGPRVFLYKELRIATKNFSENEKLGSGGFGTVYRGSIESSDTGSQTLVAVKRINYDSKHAETTFLAEISSLTQIRHGNVVQLHGWCHEKGRLLLVYDYMPNRGLNEWLHDSSGNNCKRRRELPLRVRHGILQGVAAALEYLHKDCPQCVLHRDIKSSNVMLDADLKAHLGDFGLARLMDHQKLDKTTNAAGTLGYMAPEVSYTGKATKESDVYSFGILVLEVVCARRPLDAATQELNLKESELQNHTVLLHSVWQAHETGSYLSVVDPRLLKPGTKPSRLADPQSESMIDLGTLLSFSNVHDDSNIPEVEAGKVNDVEAVLEEVMIKSLLHMGLLCCLPNPKARPTVDQVIRILQQIGDVDKVGYAVTKVSMPPLPSTNPVRLELLREFS